MFVIVCLGRWCRILQMLRVMWRPLRVSYCVSLLSPNAAILTVATHQPWTPSADYHCELSAHAAVVYLIHMCAATILLLWYCRFGLAGVLGGLALAGVLILIVVFLYHGSARQTVSRYVPVPSHPSFVCTHLTSRKVINYTQLLSTHCWFMNIGVACLMATLYTHSYVVHYTAAPILAGTEYLSLYHLIIRPNNTHVPNIPLVTRPYTAR